MKSMICDNLPELERDGQVLMRLSEERVDLYRGSEEDRGSEVNGRRSHWVLSLV